MFTKSFIVTFAVWFCLRCTWIFISLNIKTKQKLPFIYDKNRKWFVCANTPSLISQIYLLAAVLVCRCYLGQIVVYRDQSRDSTIWDRQAICMISFDMAGQILILRKCSIYYIKACSVRSYEEKQMYDRATVIFFLVVVMNTYVLAYHYTS